MVLFCAISVVNVCVRLGDWGTHLHIKQIWKCFSVVHSDWDSTLLAFPHIARLQVRQHCSAFVCRWKLGSTEHHSTPSTPFPFFLLKCLLNKLKALCRHWTPWLEDKFQTVLGSSALGVCIMYGYGYILCLTALTEYLFVLLCYPFFTLILLQIQSSVRCVQEILLFGFSNWIGGPFYFVNSHLYQFIWHTHSLSNQNWITKPIK